MFNSFAKSMVFGRAFIPMMDEDSGGGAGGGTGGEGSNGQEKGTGEGGEGGAGGDKVTFTEAQQAHIDQLIGQKVASERTKAEQKAAEAAETAAAKAKMTADELAEVERKEQSERAAAREAAANEKIISLEVKDAAREAGVPAKKLQRFLKLVDTKAITIDSEGNPSASEIKAAVSEILADMPEFKAADNQKGPGGDFNGGGTAPTYTEQQIKAMTPQEVAANYDEVMKSLAAHNKK